MKSVSTTGQMLLGVYIQLHSAQCRIVLERASKIRSNADDISPAEADHWINPPSEIFGCYCCYRQFSSWYFNPSKI